MAVLLAAAVAVWVVKHPVATSNLGDAEAPCVAVAAALPLRNHRGLHALLTPSFLLPFFFYLLLSRFDSMALRLTALAMYCTDPLSALV